MSNVTKRSPHAEDARIPAEPAMATPKSETSRLEMK